MDRRIGPLRIWTAPDHPVGSATAQISLEWRSDRPGHPTSYAVVGGTRSGGPTRLEVPEEGEAFRDAGAKGTDVVRLGLPTEFRHAIMQATPIGITYTVAAHGRYGSSVNAFTIAARLLAHVLESGLPSDDELLGTEKAIRAEVNAPSFAKLRHVTFSHAD